MYFIEGLNFKSVKIMLKNLERLILSIVLLCFLFNAEAVVVYHDENPDVTKTQTAEGYQFFNIDMNGDLQIDFILAVFKGDTTYNGLSGNGTAVSVQPSSGNAVAEGSSSPVSQAAALNNGDNIHNGLTWQSNLSVLRFNGTVMGFPASSGQFQNSEIKYIGVKFTVGSNTFYGWVRISVTSNGDSFTVMDWAYEDVPGNDIEAGETEITGMKENLISSISVISFENIIEVTFPFTLSGNVKVFNPSGSMLSFEKFSGESCRINLKGKISGIYHLVFEISEGDFAKKIYVK